MQALRQREADGTAIPLLDEAFNLRKANLGPEQPFTLDSMVSLGSSLLKSKAFNQAEPLLRECLAIHEKVQGAEHPEVAEVLDGYAAVLRKVKKEGEAAGLETRAKAIRAKAAPPS